MPRKGKEVYAMVKCIGAKLRCYDPNQLYQTQGKSKITEISK